MIQNKRLKKPLTYLAVVVAAYAVLELLSFGIYYIKHGTPFSYSHVESRMRSTSESLRSSVFNNGFAQQHPDRWMRQWALHPYLGYVRNPDQRKGDSLQQRNGFFGEADPLLMSARADTAIVGLVGGSMIENLFRDPQARKVLHERLDKLPQFAGKSVVIAMLSTGTYAQPQQYMSVAYYLAQGGRLDLLLNMDGKGEAERAHITNEEGLYSTYPNYWKQFFPWEYRAGVMMKQGDVLLWANLRHKAVSFFSPLRYSVTASMVWDTLEDSMRQRMLNLEAQVRRESNRTNAQTPYFLTGAKPAAKLNDATVTATARKQWWDGSYQLTLLANSNGFGYFHFLQPSQYLPNSKTLSAEEREKSVDAKLAASKAVPQLFPQFIADMPSLRARGTNVYDLTTIFRNVPDTVYADNCCVVNDRGNLMLAEAMGKAVADFYAKQPAKR